MCLATIKKQYDPPMKRERWAWKYFYCHPDGSLEFPWHGLRGSSVVRTDKWLMATKSRICSAFGDEYRAGFHAFTTKDDALLAGPYAPVFRVKLRGVRTIGTEALKTVLVADEMYVPSPKPKKAKKVSK